MSGYTRERTGWADPAQTVGEHWATDPHTGVTLIRLPGDRAVITGPPAGVGELLVSTQTRTGRLTAVSDPVPTGVPGQVMVTCRVLQPQPAVEARPMPARRRVPAWVWWACGTTSVAALAGVAWLVVAALAWVVTHWVAVVGGLLFAALVVGGLGRVGVCAGIHCPGCRHR